MLARLTVTGAAATAVLIALGTGTAGAAPLQYRTGAQQTVQVPCDPAALSSAIASATAGETLNLYPQCRYILDSGLPMVSNDLTIMGNGAQLIRNPASGTPAFTIFQADAGNIAVTNAGFRNGAGAISITGAADLTVTGGIFADNSAQNGGAISNTAATGPQVTGATFTDNSATGDGGAIYALDNSNIPGAPAISGSTFTGNTAAGSGGAIANDAPGSPGAVVQGSTFTANTAAIGGAVFDFGIAGGGHISGSTFRLNKAGEGGALQLDTDVYSLTNDVVEDNEAAGDGGGIGTNATSVSYTDSTITGNRAGGNGGGAYASATYGWTATNTTFNRNTAGNKGGGLYIGGTGQVDLYGGTVSFNTATGGGGGIWGNINDLGILLTLHGTTVAHNQPDDCEPLNSVAGCRN